MVPGRLTPGEHDRNPEHFRKTQERDPAWWKQATANEGAVHGAHPQLHDEAELKKDIACYYGMVSFMDDQIGRTLAELDALGIADNTIVVFTTDHGHFLGQHGLTAKAIHHYEDLIRLPFLVRWPGQVPGNRASNALQNLVDLAPTFLNAAGVPVPGGMTGLNQLPTWTGGRPVRQWSVTENHHGYRRFHLRTYVNDRYKLTVYRQDDAGELFDLLADPGEIHNRWNDPGYADVKLQLLHEFLQATLQSEPERMPRITGA
jgi:arylsulfatase A-like enzyme